MGDALTRGWEDLIGRSDGPMAFRLAMQPTMAVFFAIRAGLRDARDGQPPFLWTDFSNPGRRRELLRQGWSDVRNIFILAIVLDSIYQVLVHSGIYLLELLLTATILALVPYVIVLGLIAVTRHAVTRLARRQSPASRAEGSPGNPAKPSEDSRQERQEG